MSFFSVNGTTYSLQADSMMDSFSGEQVSKSEIEALTMLFAERLMGLKTDTLLLEDLSNTLTLAILLAAWRVGLKVALIRANMPRSQFERAVEKLNSPLYIFHDRTKQTFCVKENESSLLLEDWISETPTKPLPRKLFYWDDKEVALIFFTSGSTGAPKGVCHTLPSLMRSALAFKAHYGISSHDQIVSLAKLHTNTGLRTLALVLLDQVDVKFINKIEPPIEEATILICGPYTIEFFLRMGASEPIRFRPGLRILSLGSYLPVKTVSLMYERYQVEVLNFYGLTETFGFALADKTKNLEDCLPPPCVGVDMTLSPIDKEENLFYLNIASPNLFLGYLGEPPRMEKIWNTGDLVSLNAMGRLKLMGRASGAAKAKSGEWIFPLHLEDWLRDCPGVRDALVKVNSPLDADTLLTIYLDIDERQIHLPMQLTHKIVDLFGDDYRSIAWYISTIERSIEGKIEALNSQAWSELC